MRASILLASAFLSLAPAAYAAGPPSPPLAAAIEAQDASEVVAAIRKQLAMFSAGDRAGFIASWAAADVQIVDDVAPYIWTGPQALERWLEDTSRDIGALNLKDLAIAAKTPLRVEVRGDRAYVVLPVVVSYVRDGQPFRQDGTQVLIMSRSPQGWKTQAMSYAAPLAGPVTIP